MIVLYDLAEIVASYFQRLTAIFLVVAGAVAYVLLSAPDVFESQTKLLYRLGSDYIYVPDATESGARAPDPGDLQLVVNAEMQILNSVRLKRELVREFGVETLYPALASAPDPERKALEALENAVQIKLITGSYVVVMSVRHRNPVLAAEIATTLVERYFDLRAEIFDAENAETLRKQLAAATAQTEQIESAIRITLGGQDMLSFETERDILIEEQSSLQQQLITLDATIAALTEKESLILAELQQVAPMMIDQRETQPNPVIQDARSEQLVLEARRRATAAQLGNAHPSVIALGREIAALSEIVGAEPAVVQSSERTGSNPLYQQAEGEYLDARLQLAEQVSRREFVLSRMEENRRQIAKFAEKSSAVALSQERLSSQRQQIARLHARLQDREAIEALESQDTTNIRIIEPATPPLKPVGVPKIVRLMVAIGLGGMVALGWVLVAFFLHQPVISAQVAAQRLGIPALGEIERRALRGGRGVASSA